MLITPELVYEAVASLESTIICRHERMLSRISQRVGVDDLIQMVTIRALWSKEDCKAETPEQLNHWILVIAANAAKSLYRDHRSTGCRSTQRESFAIGVASDADDSTERSGFQPADVESDPAVRAALEETTKAVLAIIDDLPANQATAIRLRYLQQLSNDEVACEMGISNDAVRCLVSRGLAKARKQLAISLQ